MYCTINNNIYWNCNQNKCRLCSSLEEDGGQEDLPVLCRLCSSLEEDGGQEDLPVPVLERHESNQIKSSLFLISTEMIFTQIQHVYTYERSTRKAGAYQAGCLDMGKKSTQKTPFNSIIIIIIFTININNNYNNYIINNQQFQPLLSTTPA